jgi:UDP-N-acetylglucosamine:LPS N-acetylglucosamine transferase
MRVLIAAGGTGGHIYPGIAVANEILRRHPGSEVRFVGPRADWKASWFRKPDINFRSLK